MPHPGLRLQWEATESYSAKAVYQQSCVLGRYLQQELAVWTEAPEDAGPAFALSGEREYDP